MQAFDILQQTRVNILAQIDGLSDEQLNLIPSGFNNNIIWNVGHIVITQELLFYKLSGLGCNISDELLGKYRKGSKPEGDVDSAEIAQIKTLLISSPIKAKADFDKGIFKTYHSYTTSYKVTLGCIEDAVYFNNIHEGLHLGYVMAMMKCLG